MDLQGKTILTTRATSQSGTLRAKLEALGSHVIEFPTIEIVPVDDWSIVDEAIEKLPEYQWLLFTSGNAVDCFMKRVQRANVTVTVPIAVVGAATGRHLQEWRLEPALVPKEFRAEGLLETFPANLSGTSILFPRAEAGRELLPAELRRRGARVDVVTVYRTMKPASGSLADVLSGESIDCVVFTSPSTIHNLTDDIELLKKIPIAVIGPITRSAAEAHGLLVSIMPQESTIDGLIRALMDYRE
jgi:uroporphyrinogen III methyltransferase / synthase